MLLEPREALLKEAFAPFGDDLSSGSQARGDLVVAISLGREQHHLGSHHISIR
jgi:hypothetical protein